MSPYSVVSASELVDELLVPAGQLCLPATSDYAALRPDDVLVVERTPAEAIRPGRLVVFRRGGRLLGCRVGSAGADDRGHFLEATCEARPGGEDEQRVRDEELLGVVRAVRRGERETALPAPRGSSPHPLETLVVSLAGAAGSVSRLAGALTYPLQLTPPYRWLGGLWVRRATGAFDLVLEVPFGNGVGLVRRVRGAALASFDLSRLDPPARSCTFVFERRRTVAARLSVSLATSASGRHVWRVQNVWARRHYEGLGLTAVLTARAKTVLKRSGFSGGTKERPSPARNALPSGTLRA